MKLAEGRYVRVVGDSFPPGHALYRAEGTVEGVVPDGHGGELVQVLCARPWNVQGKLVHVLAEKLEPARRRR